VKRPGEEKQESVDNMFKLGSEPSTSDAQKNNQNISARLDYSHTGVTLGNVAKRPTFEHKHRLGIFARSWPEWVTVETAINMDIDWICLKEPTLFDVLTAIYVHATVVTWKEGVVPPR
jgi:hypothetical protein